MNAREDAFSVDDTASAVAMPRGKPIFIVQAGNGKLPEGLAGESDDYLLIPSPGGGQT